MAQVAHNLIGIVGFGEDGVLKRDRIIFARTACDGNTLGGHDFQRDQAKGLMTAIRQCCVCGGIRCAHKFFWQEEAQVVNVGRSGLGNSLEALFKIWPLGYNGANIQPNVLGMTQDTTPARFATTTSTTVKRMAPSL